VGDGLSVGNGNVVLEGDVVALDVVDGPKRWLGPERREEKKGRKEKRETQSEKCGRNKPLAEKEKLRGSHGSREEHEGT
jgi:hypothetical protein